jgi:chromosomal replication initiation ATPase DnaA
MNRFDVIKDIVSKEVGVARSRLDGKSKEGLLPWARHITIWVAAQFPETSNVRDMIRAFHRTHSAINHALKVVCENRSSDQKLRSDTDRILTLCKPSNRLREIDFIKAVVATHLDVPLSSMNARDRINSRARHIAYWVASKSTSLKRAALAAAFGVHDSGLCTALQQMEHTHLAYPLEAEVMDTILRIVTAAFIAEGLCCPTCRQPLPAK